MQHHSKLNEIRKLRGIRLAELAKELGYKTLTPLVIRLNGTVAISEDWIAKVEQAMDSIDSRKREQLAKLTETK
jgi:transcriptional regulator with XRE-family HTH domain